MVGISGKVAEDDDVGESIAEPKDGDAALGDGDPFSTSTTADPRVSVGAAGGGAASSESCREEDEVDVDFFFHRDRRLDRLPDGDPLGSANVEDAAGGGLVGVPVEGTELEDEVDELLDDRPSERRILEDLRLKKESTYELGPASLLTSKESPETMPDGQSRPQAQTQPPSSRTGS